MLCRLTLCYLALCAMPLYAVEPALSKKIGILIQHTQDAYGQQKTSALPFAFYEQGMFYIEGNDAGFTLHQALRTQVRAGVSLDMHEYKPYDIKPSALAGVNITHVTPLGGIRARVLTDISGRHEGQSVSLSYLAKVQKGTTTLIPSIGVVHHSKAYNRYHLGLNDSSAHPFAQVTGFWDVNESMGLIGSARIDALSSTQKNAPFVRESSESSLNLGAYYRF